MRDLPELAFRRYYGHVYRYLRRRTGSHDEAEELAQTVFADAAARLREVKPGSPPVLAWLYTVAQRRLADRARRGARAEALAAVDADRAAPVEEQAYGAEVALALREALEQLPDGQRRVVVMKLLEGRSFAEIASRVGATEAACKMRFARGLEAVRGELSKRGLAP